MLEVGGEPIGSPGAAAEAWLQHFGAQELARLVTDEEASACLRDAVTPAQSDDVSSLMTLQQLEWALARASDGAPGTDGIPGGVLRRFAAPLAALLLPLMTKASVTGCPPVQWQGGWLATLYKGRGRAADPASHRSILITSHIGKVWHGHLRKALLGQVPPAKLGAQFGGIPGRGAVQAVLALRSYMEGVRRSGRACRLFFVDVKEAYYSLLRELVLPGGASEQQLASLLGRLDLPAAVGAALMQRLRGPSALEELGTDPDLIRQLRGALRNTWFVVPGSSKVALPTRGTRPGTPLADALFATVLDQLMEVLHGRLRSAGLGTILPEVTQCLEATGGEVVASALCYADDVVVLGDSSTAQVISDAQRMAGIVLSTVLEFGLAPNLRDGKSELLLAFTGRGATQCKQELWHRRQRQVVADTIAGPLPVRCVRQYTYLGSLITDGRRDDRAVLGHRRAASSGALATLRRRVFPRAELPSECALRLLEALLTSGRLYAVEALPALSSAAARALHADAVALLRLALRVPRKSAGAVPDCELWARAGRPPVEVQLRLKRLRLWAQVLGSAPSVVLAAVATVQGPPDASWWSACLADLDWLRRLSPAAREELPPPQVCLDPWVARAADGAAWKALLRSAYQAHAADYARQAHAAAFEARFIARCEASGLAVPTAPAVPPLPELFRCPCCPKRYTTRRAARAHLAVHVSASQVMRSFVGDGDCRCCMTRFSSRASVLKHVISDAPRCMLFLLRQPVLAEDEQEAALAVERACEAAARGAGFHRRRAEAPAIRLPGPCPQDAAELLLLGQEEARRRCWRLLLITRCRDPSCLDLLLAPDPVGSPVGALPAPAISGHPARCWAEPAELARGVFAAGAIPSSGWAWSEASSAGASPFAGRPLRRRTLFLLNLFCGARRQGDIQEQFELAGSLHSSHFSVFVLSVDVVIDPVRCDLTNAGTLEQWRQHIRAGRIAGVGGGPPCETWSAARHSAGGPPPLRDWARPWGLAGCTARQSQQLDIGNFLLMALLDLMLECALSGGAAWMEHPAPAVWEPGAVPSWATAPLECLRRAPGVAFTSFDQCEHGQSARAPTVILSAGMASLPGLLLATPGGGKCSHPRGTHRRLLGVDATGAFRTAAKKTYPPALCQCIAAGMRDSLLARAGLPPSSDAPDEAALAAADPEEAELLRGLLAFHVTAVAVSGTGLVGPDFAPPPRAAEGGRVRLPGLLQRRAEAARLAGAGGLAGPSAGHAVESPEPPVPPAPCPPPPAPPQLGCLRQPRAALTASQRRLIGRRRNQALSRRLWRGYVPGSLFGAAEPSGATARLEQRELFFEPGAA